MTDPQPFLPLELKPLGFTGIVDGPFDLFQTDSGPQNFTGTVSGSTTTAGTAVGVAGLTGTVSGETVTSGTAVGTLDVRGTVAGAIVTSGTVVGSGGTDTPVTTPSGGGRFPGLEYPRRAPEPPKKPRIQRKRGTARGVTYCRGRAVGTAATPQMDDDAELLLLQLI
jgi:hypothetical protein